MLLLDLQAFACNVWTGKAYHNLGKKIWSSIFFFYEILFQKHCVFQLFFQNVTRKKTDGRRIIQEFDSQYEQGFGKVLFTVRYTNRQITALTFFAITKTITKIDGKWDCWVCQILKFASKRQNSLILKVRKWIQKSDSIQIWSRPA